MWWEMGRRQTRYKTGSWGNKGIPLLLQPFLYVVLLAVLPSCSLAPLSSLFFCSGRFACPLLCRGSPLLVLLIFWRDVKGHTSYVRTHCAMVCAVQVCAILVIRPFIMKIFLGSKMGPFRQRQKNNNLMRLKTEQFRHRFFWTPVWHGDLDHSELQNDTG